MPITQVPGPAGPAGADGTDGTDGSNAFTDTTAGFVMPAISGNVTIAVADTSWMAVGEPIFIENAGSFLVNNVLSGTSVSVTNLGYPGNVVPTTVVAGGQHVTPSGVRGATGAAGSTPTLNNISPTTTKGDIIVDNGALSPAASDVRFAAGTDGQQLTALAAQPTGLIYRTITPNAATDNIVPRFDSSGATTPTPLQASGLLISDTGAVQSTPTGGNARGASAIDLQVVRAAATQVASGADAIIPGGLNNTASGAAALAAGTTNLASGAAAVALGASNTASNTNAIAIGDSSTASGAQSTALGDQHAASGTAAACLGGSLGIADGAQATTVGGLSNIAHGDYSVALGRISVADTGAENGFVSGFRGVADKYGQHTHASGIFAAPGDAQTSDLLWRGATTNATPTELFLDGSALRAVLGSNTTWAFEIIGVARRSDGISACFKVDGGIKNTGGTVVLVAANTTIVTADGTGAALGAGSFVASADDPNNALIITVTGVIASSYRWVARARLVEVHF